MVTPSALQDLGALRRRGAAIIRRQEGRRNEALLGHELVETALGDLGRRARLRAVAALKTVDRAEPCGESPQTVQMTQGQAADFLAALGIQVVSGSGTFTAGELRNATIRTFYHTERGFFAEMRFEPNGPPFYAPITSNEQAQLESGIPPGNLVARLFTEIEPVDN